VLKKKDPFKYKFIVQFNNGMMNYLKSRKSPI